MDPPVLSKAKPGEPLSLYIAAGPKAVSSALVREEGEMQSPVYYVSQVLKDAETRYPNLEKFALALVHSSRKLRSWSSKPPENVSRKILEATLNITILQINREENSTAEELSKLVQNSSDLVSSVYFEELKVPSTERAEVLCIGSPDNWMTSYITYLRDGTLPEDQNKARYLKHKAARFFLEEGQLYRRAFSAPTLKCIDPEEANYCLREVHEGICGDHLAAKALAYKIIRQGQSPSLPASVLSPIPFAVWGIDIMGPFPRAKGDLRYILVAIDYMTKWEEAKAMRTINQQDCIKFMDAIVMRFGIPVVLISDNGPQFVGSEFEAYLKELGIKHKRASVAHPQGNGQVEVTNRTILRGLEKRLEETKKN
ncbi:uncharacterized protein LOC141661035 [Apium graveolens]|uniref:uncharacterized protein LOC141661035 n=1 Tax=Apium graveolens TaxID=4045 RepID=UPI003D7BCC5C